MNNKENQPIILVDSHKPLIIDGSKEVPVCEKTSETLEAKSKLIAKREEKIHDKLLQKFLAMEKINSRGIKVY